MSVPISLRTELARERAVDLDLVGREAAERGIAGAEIVHRDADAELAGLLPDSAKRWNRFGNRTGRNSPLIGRIGRRGPPGSSFGRLFR